jgi:hypothetical protein
MSNVIALILIHDPADNHTGAALQAAINESGWFRSTGFVRVDLHPSQADLLPARYGPHGRLGGAADTRMRFACLAGHVGGRVG